LPRVTALPSSKRRPGWVDVQLDGAFACRLPGDAVDSIGLRIGDEIAPAELEALEDEAHRQEAMRQALHYLSIRPRSRWEVRRNLRKKGYEDPAVGAALERCETLGYLDDRSFAAAYARDRIRLRPRSIRMMVSELGAKGVARPDAEAGIEEALRDERVNERELLERAARKGSRTLGGMDPRAGRRRLFAYLSRRGFASGAIRECLDEVSRDIWGDLPDDIE
jgi:regulatory protein